MKRREVSLRQQMREWLLSLGYGTRVTARDLYKKYGELGGKLNEDGTCNSTMFKLQFHLPLKRTDESVRLGGFSIRLVFTVDEETELKLRELEETKQKPKQIWQRLKEGT